MKNKKALIAILAALVVIAAVLLIWQPWKTNEAPAAAPEAAEEAAKEEPAAEEPAAEAKVKLGVILLHDEDSTYDLNFINGVKDAQKKLGLTDDQVIFKTNIPESSDCYEAAAEMVDAGCSLVFADSFGHESFLLEVAKEFPEVEFAHATGTMAHTEKLPNFHNAFASIYEGRYLAGVAAGMKLNELKEAGKI